MSQSNVTEGFAFRGQVSAADFAQWLPEFFAEPCAVIYIQHSLKPGEHGVCIADTLPADFALPDWEQGRIFNNEFELRWQMQEDSVSILALTEQRNLPAACAGLCEWQAVETAYDVISTKHILVGTFYPRQDGLGFFAEASIPRQFCYPMRHEITPQERTRAILHGKHYRRIGRTVLTRFTRFATERRQGGEPS